MTRRKLIKLLAPGVCVARPASAIWTGSDSARTASVRDESSQAGVKSSSVPAREQAVSSARAVLTRLLGSRATEFSLDWTPPENDHMLYEVGASGGTVSIKGSSGVAISRGAYAYLRHACKSMVTWSGRHLTLPTTFPDHGPNRVVCPYEFVQYYNVCTFGYSTAFWNWERWQRELDWMALHGVTMPLALDAQEAIWHRVWISMGLTRAELDRFSTGPGHLPWHRMGNINNFDGPLPQGWMDQKRELQHKILGRMRELGMTPIVPAFSGHVPEGFKRLHPQAKTSTLLWGTGTLPRQTKTFFLHPGEDQLFVDIGGRFIQEYSKEFGVGGYYLADPFNELKVPVTKEHRFEELAQYGRKIYESIQAGDPDGKWVLQGWLFVDVDFWDPQSVKAFLSQVPGDRMLIIDYANDLIPNMFPGMTLPQGVWKANEAFNGKPWINGMIHTFGGNNNVKGNLALIDSQPAEVLASPQKGNLVGWGICPEGIETNEVVYELMTEIGWSDHKIPLQDWLADYCRARYGDCPPAMNEAWKLLLQSAYSSHFYMSKHAWQMRPTLDPKALNLDAGPVFVQAVEQFLSCAERLKSSELYRHDLIEFVGQAAGGSVDRHLAAACQAHKSGNADARDHMVHQSLEMLLRIDAIMNLRQDRRLETWTHNAQSWGQSPDEAVYYDSNSRRLITF